MLKKTIEIYIENIGFFAALSIILTATTIGFEALGSILPKLEATILFLSSLSYVVLEAFCAFIAHRAFFLNERYNFRDFLSKRNWPNKQFIYLTIIFSLIFFPVIFYLILFEQNNVLVKNSEENTVHFEILMWFALVTFTIYLILFGLFGLAFPAAAIGEDCTFRHIYHLAKGHRTMLFSRLIVVIVITAIFTFLIMFGIENILTSLNMPEFALDDHGGFHLIGIFPEYIISLLSLFIPTAIVVAISQTYKDAKNDNLDH